MFKKQIRRAEKYYLPTGVRYTPAEPIITPFLHHRKSLLAPHYQFCIPYRKAGNNRNFRNGQGHRISYPHLDPHLTEKNRYPGITNVVTSDES
jgi:hypothetical protein